VTYDHSPGFTVSQTGLTYTPGVWQEWDLQYAIGASTFSVSVGGSTASGLGNVTQGQIRFADLFNGNPTPGGTFFLDGVPPPVSSAPEPASVGVTGGGLVCAAWLRRLLKK
jgi:hypothetical protein